MDRKHGLRLVAVVVICLVTIFQFSVQLRVIAPVDNQVQVPQTQATHHNNDTRPALPTSLSFEEPWTSIQQATVGFHFFHDSIEEVRVIGERHSGTTFLTKYLQSCFPRGVVKDFLVRKKHWFQPNPEAIVNAARRYGRSRLEITNPTNFEPGYKTWWEIAQDPHPRGVFNNTLLLVIVRNPYQWLEAMRQKPWHWPNHVDIVPKQNATLATIKYQGKSPNYRKRRLLGLNNSTLDDGRVPHTSERRAGRERIGYVPQGVREGGKLPQGIQVQKSYVDHNLLDWQTFVARPMELSDSQLLQVQPSLEANAICKKGYLWGTLSPCVQNRSYVPPTMQHIPRAFLRNLPFAVNDVVYELQDNGKPYEHPLALRTAKIRNFLQVAQEWDFAGVAILRYEDLFASNPKDGNDIRSVTSKLSEALRLPPHCMPLKHEDKRPHELSKEFSKWITNHTDWHIERIVGFAPEDDG